LRDEFTDWKKNIEWLKKSKTAPAQGSWRGAVDDANKTFDKYLSRSKFRSRKNHNHSSYKDQPGVKYFSIGQSGFRLSKVGWVKALIDTSGLMSKKLYNIRISYDGLKYWCSFAVDCENQTIDAKQTGPIGIDLGVKTFATCSNGWIKESPSHQKYLKRMKKNQRKAAKRYDKMTKDEKKSKRLIKLEKKILKDHKKIHNIQKTFIHCFTKELINQNPKRIVIEDVKYAQWAKDKHQQRKVIDNQYYEFRRQLEYKCEWHGIELVLADKWYASTQICCSCGNIKTGKDKLKRGDNTYKCDCGHELDRDLNASLNLKHYKAQ
jgi:putative transposase